MILQRTPQRTAPFVPGRPDDGYYNDLRPHLARYVPELRRFDESFATLTGDARQANPVTVIQVGLGAWQAGNDDPRWHRVVDAVATWIVDRLGADGALEYRSALRGTFRLDPPWLSAMAQGEAASFLVRAAATLVRPELLTAAVVAAQPLVDGRSGLVVETPDGPVLEEYPTTPPSHVLNGWIFALWGLYDVAHSQPGDGTAGKLFVRSTETLAARLPTYEIFGGWSRYDVFPHPLINVASPFYHSLHVAQLIALAQLHPDDRLSAAARRWAAAAGRPAVYARAVVGKVAFRMVRPRRRRR